MEQVTLSDSAFVAVAVWCAWTLFGGRAHADTDQPVLGDPAPPRLGEASDEETRALVHRRIGDHQLRIRESDRTVALVDAEDVGGRGGFEIGRASCRERVCQYV